VRAQARGPGGPLVECEPVAGTRAVIIEDVVASGGSAARAIQALQAETGLRVAGVQSIANWNFPEMRHALASWTVRAVTSYPQVLASAQEAGLLSAADVARLTRFYTDPRRHGWLSCPPDDADLSGAHFGVTRVSIPDCLGTGLQHLSQIAGHDALQQSTLTVLN